VLTEIATIIVIICDCNIENLFHCKSSVFWKSLLFTVESALQSQELGWLMRSLKRN